jgi:ribosomal protein S18 acetylase RimI-like enzyme
MQIREFTLNDYEQVWQLWQICQVPNPESREEIERKLQRDPDLFLVAESNAVILGVVMGVWDGRRAWIHNYGVDPRCRRMGVGSALIRELERRLRERGIKRVNTLVRRDDLSAQDFYEALGFREEQWVVMEKSLLPEG